MNEAWSETVEFPKILWGNLHREIRNYPAMNYDICPDCGAKPVEPVEPDGVNTFVLHCPICGWELITIRERRDKLRLWH